MPAQADLTELQRSMIVGRPAEYDRAGNIETRLDPHELENGQQHQYEVLSEDHRKPVADCGMQPDDVTQTLWELKDIERIAPHDSPGQKPVTSGQVPHALRSNPNRKAPKPAAAGPEG